MPRRGGGRGVGCVTGVPMHADSSRGRAVSGLVGSSPLAHDGGQSKPTSGARCSSPNCGRAVAVNAGPFCTCCTTAWTDALLHFLGELRHLLAELSQSAGFIVAGIARELEQLSRVIGVRGRVHRLASRPNTGAECARAGCARFQRDLFANKLAKDATQVSAQRRAHPKRSLLRIADRLALMARPWARWTSQASRWQRGARRSRRRNRSSRMMILRRTDDLGVSGGRIAIRMTRPAARSLRQFAAIAAHRGRSPAEFRGTRAGDAGADRLRIGADDRRVRTRDRRLHASDRGTSGAGLPVSRHRTEPGVCPRPCDSIPVSGLRSRQRRRSDADPREPGHRRRSTRSCAGCPGRRCRFRCKRRCSPQWIWRWCRVACS